MVPENVWTKLRKLYPRPGRELCPASPLMLPVIWSLCEVIPAHTFYLNLLES